MKGADLMLRLRALFRGRRVEQELDEELESHLELQTRKYMDEGFDEAAARHRACLDFGGIEQAREECRQVRGVQWIENIGKDLKYGLRTLRKSPGFTLTAMLALAVGVGANVALTHSLLSALKPRLPFREPTRISVLWLKSEQDPHIDEMMASVADLVDWRAQTHSFTSIAATTWTENMNFGGNGAAERIRAFEVTANLFDTLGVQPRFGRAFLDSEEQSGHNRVAILGDSFRARHYPSAAAALGSSIRLDGEFYTVVGVLAPDFSVGFLPDPDVLVPLALDTSAALDRRQRVILGLARLRDGATVDQARNDIAAIQGRLGREHFEDRGWTAHLNPLPSEGTQDARDKLPFFAAIAAVVLLLACLNAAVLSLARYLARHPEMVLRNALGAGRGRLAQQIVCEGLLLSIFAGAVGFAIALGGIALIREYEPFYSNFPIAALPDWRIFLYYGFLIGGVTLLFSSAPAVTISRSAVASGLNAGSPRIASGGVRLSWLSMIVQIGAAVAVLSLTGLMARTVAELYHFDLGFVPDQLLEGEIVLRGARYASAAAQRDFFRRLMERMETDHRVPAALTSHFPLSESYGMSGYAIQLEDRPLEVIDNRSRSAADAVSINFFSVIGAKLIRGRDFQRQEVEPVAIINETFARKFFAGEDPVGKRIVVRAPMSKEMDELSPGARRIIGVVKDVSQWGPRSSEGFPNVYVPFDQNPVPWVSVVIRRSATAGADLVKAAVAELDPDLPVFRIQTARELVDQAYAPPRFQLIMLILFSWVALFLSAIGIFSLVAHSVRRRHREFGIRLALGARPAQIRRLALRGGFAVAGMGLPLGLGLAALLGRLMATLLYHVKPWDAQIAAAALLLVATCVLIACFIPAYEASRTDPMSAVRDE